MGGYWQLVFVCCLLVQSISAEDSVKDNSTPAVNDNSTSVAHDNLTSAANDNSTSAAKDNSTSVAHDNSTSAANDNLTSAAKDNSTSAANDNLTSAEKDNSTSVVHDNSTSAAKDNSTSVANQDEELEKNIGQRMASLREMGQDEIRNFSDLALQNFNVREKSLFTTLGDATVMIKKAVGSILSLRMTVEKTNCTKKDMNSHSRFGYYRSLDFENEEPPKYCGPLDGDDKEQLDCKFDIFKDERSYREAPVSHDCKPVKVIDRKMITDPEM